MKTVRNKFKFGRCVVMKCGSSIENYEPGTNESDTRIINTLHWSTEPYRTKLFNDYTFFSLKETILKRVIVNGMNGSSCCFRQFVHINLKVLRKDGNFLR